MIRKTVALLALSFCAVSAHAQLAAYASVSVTQLTGLQSSPYAANLAGYKVRDSVNPLGITFGGYYDFKTVGPVRLGADVRGVIVSTNRGAEVAFDGTGAKISSTLGGIRGSFKVYKAFDGYVQGSAGLGRSNYGFASAVIDPSITLNGHPPEHILTKSSFEYDAYVGMQVHVTPIADFRIFEVGYGALVGNGHSYPLKSVSTGVVFHFPTKQ